MAIKRLLIICSGGDAPGVNAALRAIVRFSSHEKIELVGSDNGYQGLIEQTIRPLSSNDVANILQRGGSLLRSARFPEFKERAMRDQARQFLAKEKIDGIIVIGGNGSLRGADLLAEEGGPLLVGIPCTIDNDVHGTEYCLGFDTARNTALDAIDRIRDTAFSIRRNFIVEIMGRDAGFLAVDVGIAGGADIILTPEFPLSLDELLAKIRRKTDRKLTSIIVAAEAGHPGHSVQLAKDIQEKAGIKYTVCILGHIQRGGTPNAMDRKIGALMGVKAVETLLQGKTSMMIVKKSHQLGIAELPNANHPAKRFNNPDLIKLNDIICEI